MTELDELKIELAAAEAKASALAEDWPMATGLDVALARAKVKRIKAEIAELEVRNEQINDHQ